MIIFKLFRDFFIFGWFLDYLISFYWRFKILIFSYQINLQFYFFSEVFLIDHYHFNQNRNVEVFLLGYQNHFIIILLIRVLTFKYLIFLHLESFSFWFWKWLLHWFFLIIMNIWLRWEDVLDLWLNQLWYRIKLDWSV